MTEPSLRAPHEALIAVAAHGRMPEVFPKKLRAAAEIAIGDFDGDLAEVIQRPAAAARRALLPL